MTPRCHADDSCQLRHAIYDFLSPMPYCLRYFRHAALLRAYTAASSPPPPPRLLMMLLTMPYYADAAIAVDAVAADAMALHATTDIYCRCAIATA